MSVIQMDKSRMTQEHEQEEFLTKEELKSAQGKAERRPAFQPWYADQESENVLAVKEFGAKFKIVNNVWTPIARNLWKLYKEIQSCNPSTILFIEIEDGKKQYRGKPVVMEVAVLSQQLSELFKQMSGFNFSHVVRIYQTNADDKSHEQLLVHLYKQLRQIKEDGKLRDYDEKEFTEIQANLRRDWNADEAFIPDIIKCGNWLTVKNNNQQCLFDETMASQ